MSAQQIAALKERAKLQTPTKSSLAHGLSDKVNLCICNRQLQDILCRSCGYLFVGRQRKQCVLHPNEIHLMDSAVCPKCRTNSLIEIKTSDTPVKKPQDEVITELSHLRQRRSSGHEKRTEDENWDTESGTFHPPRSSATFGTPRPTRNTTDADWENEIGTCNSYPYRASTCTVGISSPPPSNTASHGTSIPSKTSPTRLATSHFSKTTSASCTARDWETEINQAPKAFGTVNSASSGSGMKQNNAVAPVTRKVTFAPLKTENQSHRTEPVSAQGNAVQQDGHKSIEKPKSKMVDSEVQTEFIVQIMEEPKFLNPVARPAVQPVRTYPGSEYMYQPKRPVDGEKETSILRAAIRRSITQGWHREMDKMNDLCIGDR